MCLLRQVIPRRCRVYFPRIPNTRKCRCRALWHGEQESEVMRTTMLTRRTTDATPVEGQPGNAAQAGIAECAIAGVTIQGNAEDEEEQSQSALVCFRCRRVY